MRIMMAVSTSDQSIDRSILSERREKGAESSSHSIFSSIFLFIFLSFSISLSCQQGCCRILKTQSKIKERKDANDRLIWLVCLSLSLSLCAFAISVNVKWVCEGIFVHSRHYLQSKSIISLRERETISVANTAADDDDRSVGAYERRERERKERKDRLSLLANWPLALLFFYYFYIRCYEGGEREQTWQFNN